MIDEELVQLLTPEGERVAHPEYESTLGGERDLRALPRHGDHPSNLQRVDVAPAPGPARAVGAGPGPRGRPDRRRAGPGADGLHLPDVPRARHRVVPRRAARGHAAALSRGEQRRLGPPEVPPLRADRRPGQPGAARRRLRHGRPARRRRGGRHDVLRRRRLEPGRRARGVRVGGVVQRAGRLLLPEQPVGHLDAVSAPVQDPALPPRATASVSPASASTATTCSRSTR